jgi:hypothetical protein
VNFTACKTEEDYTALMECRGRSEGWKKNLSHSTFIYNKPGLYKIYKKFNFCLTESIMPRLLSIKTSQSVLLREVTGVLTFIRNT